MKAFGGLLPAEQSRPAGEKVTHDVTASVLAIGPRHGLDDDAARRAVDSSHGVAEEDANIPQRDETKQGCGQSIVSRPCLAALRAARLAVSASLNIDDYHRIVAFLHCFQLAFTVNETLDWVDPVE